MTGVDSRGNTLADAGPSGFLTPLGWAEASPDSQERTLPQESARRIKGAAHALHAQCWHTEPTRAAALAFVAYTMLEQARVMRRALGGLNAEPEDTPPKPQKRRRPAGADMVKLHAAGEPAHRAT